MHVTNEENKPWDQMEGESDLWYGRFRSYLLMGFKRSVQAVFQLEVEEIRGNQRLEAYGYWYEVAKKYKWEKRAKAHDKCQRDEEDKIIAQERDKVFRSGFSLDYKRIEALNKLAEKMVNWAEEEDKIWLIKTQDVTSENFSKRTEETVFNAPLLNAISKYLDDIAKEKGERVKKQELDVKDSRSSQKDVEVVNEVIEKALENHPEARIALAEALVELGKASESFS